MCRPQSYCQTDHWTRRFIGYVGTNATRYTDQLGQFALELLPITDASIDLVTTSLAFHWFDRICFMPEVQRMLKPGAWLVIYHNRFCGDMLENSAYLEWQGDHYGKCYPAPARYHEPLTDDDLRRYSFSCLEHEDYINYVTFTPDSLTQYMMTHSNVTAAITKCGENPQDIYRWLLESVMRYFVAEAGTFKFGGTIDYFQKAGTNYEQ